MVYLLPGIALSTTLTTEKNVGEINGSMDSLICCVINQTINSLMERRAGCGGGFHWRAAATGGGGAGRCEAGVGDGT